MKKIILIVLLLTLNSCYQFKENGIQFSIKNKSNFSIKNVKFTTSEKLNTIAFNKIEPDESVDSFLSMKNNKTDGSYILEFTDINGNKKSESFGYYSNGQTANGEYVVFEINNNSITSKFGIINQNDTKKTDGSGSKKMVYFDKEIRNHKQSVRYWNDSIPLKIDGGKSIFFERIKSNIDIKEKENKYELFSINNLLECNIIIKDSISKVIKTIPIAFDADAFMALNGINSERVSVVNLNEALFFFQFEMSYSGSTVSIFKINTNVEYQQFCSIEEIKKNPSVFLSVSNTNKTRYILNSMKFVDRILFYEDFTPRPFVLGNDYDIRITENKKELLISFFTSEQKYTPSIMLSFDGEKLIKKLKQ